MQINEFKDKMFDILNETDSLPVTDIIVNDRKDEIRILLDDHSSFVIKCSTKGFWFLVR